MGMHVIGIKRKMIEKPDYVDGVISKVITEKKRQLSAPSTPIINITTAAPEPLV